MGGVWAAGFGLVFWFYPHILLGVFNVQDPIVLALGGQLLKFLAFSGFFLAIALSYTGALQGAGETKMPMYIAFITQIVVVLGICEVLRRMGILQAHHIWGAILAGHFTRLVLTYLVYQREQWIHINVELDERRG
jgi:Na+-driven multidrug efflux pump